MKANKTMNNQQEEQGWNKLMAEMSPNEKSNMLNAVINIMVANKSQLGGHYDIKEQTHRVILTLLKSIK